MTNNRYWVVGGDYEGDNFDALVPGSERMAGPFASIDRARKEWTRLTFCDANPCQRRYAIASEGGVAA